jgi:LysM repeat protein
MQITHEEAHELIQFSMDQALEPQERKTLQAHLADCLECRGFADELSQLRNLLLPTMRNRWNLRPAPLSLETLRNKRKLQLQTSNLLVTRTALISLVFAAFIFSTWQFTHAGRQIGTPIPLNVLPIATPSGETTSTLLSVQNCVEMKYQVQENDTLESIAAQFSVPIGQIMALNNLRTKTLDPNLELRLPVCEPTTTSTVTASTQTTTFTPVIGSTTSAPGG